MYLNPAASSWTPQTSIDSAVEAFHRQLPDYNETPLVPLPSLAAELGLGHVLVKDESQRFGLPAFKIVGASWAVYRAVTDKLGLAPTTSLDDLGPAAREAGVQLVTASEGNWGRAVARMAKYLGVAATVHVPRFMDEATQARIASEGARVAVVEGDYDATVRVAMEEARSTGGLLMLDTAWEGYMQIPQWVTDGYTTILSEVARQAQEIVGRPVTCAVVSVGVGSWAHAVTTHYKGKGGAVSVAAVEPETAACLQRSLRAGRIVSIETGETIMNGMNCGTVSALAWPVLSRGVDASVSVSDRESHEMVEYLRANGVEAGPCGAAPLSALRRLCKENKVDLGQDSVVVLFSSEGPREYPEPGRK